MSWVIIGIKETGKEIELGRYPDQVDLTNSVLGLTGQMMDEKCIGWRIQIDPPRPITIVGGW